MRPNLPTIVLFLLVSLYRHGTRLPSCQLQALPVLYPPLYRVGRHHPLLQTIRLLILPTLRPLLLVLSLANSPCITNCPMIFIRRLRFASGSLPSPRLSYTPYLTYKHRIQITRSSGLMSVCSTSIIPREEMQPKRYILRRLVVKHHLANLLKEKCSVWLNKRSPQILAPCSARVLSV